MHDLYVSFNVKDLQKAMFRQESLPAVVMNPRDANQSTFAGTSNWCVFVTPKDALPPKVRCHTRRACCAWCRGSLGWSSTALLLALEEGINMLPGFSPELQGVYSEKDADGIKRLYGYVLK